MEKVGSLIARAVQSATVKNASANTSSESSPGSGPPLKEFPQKLPTKRSHSVEKYSSIDGDGRSSKKESADQVAADLKKAERSLTSSRNRNWPPRASSELMLVKSVLAKALARKGLEKKIERYAFILHWKEIVGESLAIICKPECLSRNTLVIRVINSGWAQEISFMKPVLLQRLSQYLPPGDLVDDITFRVGPL